MKHLRGNNIIGIADLDRNPLDLIVNLEGKFNYFCAPIRFMPCLMNCKALNASWRGGVALMMPQLLLLKMELFDRYNGNNLE